jgi:hypothetical protein
LAQFSRLCCGIACLTEDPTTKRHQPRNYLETLEERVALLEGLLQQSRPDVASPSLATRPIDPKDGSRSAASRPGNEGDGESDLSSKAGMLGFKAAGAEPYYLGSSSAFAFSRLIHSCVRQAVPGKSTDMLHFTKEDPSKTSPCPLPDYNVGLTLSNAYFQNIHLQYPFLHEPTFRIWETKVTRLSGSTDTLSADPVPLFFVNMVSRVLTT